jgi:serine/threonine protein kinase
MMSEESANLTLGAYRVLKRENGALWELGKGSYGTTYKAEHMHLERVAALKVINDHLVRDDSAKLRFKEEAKAASKLRNAHIANIDDFGEVDGVFYYVMEYCSGGDLEEYSQKNGPLPWSVVRDFALQILDALKAAHSKGMLHRDLKPSNVMLADSSEPVNLRLIDFGLVKALDQNIANETAVMATREGAFMGNALTASPEQFRQEDLDERSDLFSLGVTLWYLLNGESPFGTSSTAQIAHQRLSVENYDDCLPPHLEAKGRAILHCLLCSDREQRFRYAQDAIDAINGVGAIPAPSSPLAPSQMIEPEEFSESLPLSGIGALNEQWQIVSTVKQLRYGTYYGCSHRLDGSVPAASLFIPDASFPFAEDVRSFGEKLVSAGSLGLCNFFAHGDYEGHHAFLCQSLSCATLQTLLQRVNRLNLQHDLSLLKQVSLGVDEARDLGMPGVELEDGDIYIAVNPTMGHSQLQPREWESYIDNEARGEGGNSAGLVAVVLPRLADESVPQEVSATIGGDDLASNPIARFSGFLYRVLSGMSAKQTAYLSSHNYVSFSDVSEESNQYLSQVIAGLEVPESATLFLRQICQNEGVFFDGPAASVQASVLPTSFQAPLSAPPGRLTAPPKLSTPSQSATTLAPSPASVPAPVVPPQLTSPSNVGIISPTASVGVAGPSPVQSASNRSKQKEKRGKKPLVISILVLLLLGLLGVGGYFAYEHSRKTKKVTRRSQSGITHDGPIQAREGTLAFTKVSFSEGFDDVPVGLSDALGVVLGEIKIQGGAIQVVDFPLDVFDSSDRWPLTFMSLHSGFVVSGDDLAQSLFSDDGAGGYVNETSLELSARAMTRIAPTITVNGVEVPEAARLMKYLASSAGLREFQHSVEDGKARIELPPGQRFPIKASLRIPYFNSVSVNLTAGEDLDVVLKVATRKVVFFGLQPSHSLSFAADLSQIKEEAVRDLLRVGVAKELATGVEILGQKKTWALPAPSGSLTLGFEGKEKVVQVSMDVAYLAVAGVETRMLSESDEISRLRSFAERGDAVSQSNLAQQMYTLEEFGGRPPDVVRALVFQWYTASASQKHVPAMTELGIAYRDGNGVNQDSYKALDLIQQATNAGSARAKAILGSFYETGLPGRIKKDMAKAKTLYQEAAEQGSGFGMAKIAIVFINAENYEEAHKWLVKGVEESDPFCTYALGLFYYDGRVVEQDQEEGLLLIKKAAALNDPNAKGFLEELK